MPTQKTIELKEKIQSYSKEELELLLETAIFEMESYVTCCSICIQSFKTCDKKCYIEILNYLVKQTNENEEGANVKELK